MFCKRCGREISGADGSIFCSDCERIVYGRVGSYEQPESERSVKVNAGIYKLLCICMGLCLVAGSVVWAALFMRDRMDKHENTAVLEASADEEPMLAEPASQTKVSAAKSSTTTTTTTVTTTTTTTTTTDPYKQTITPRFLDSYGTMFSIADELPVRIGPGYDYERMDITIPSGTALSVSAEQVDEKSGETWSYINYNEKYGWVPKTLLSAKNPTVAAVLPDEYYYGSDRYEYTVKRFGGLNLYSGPGEEYDVIFKLEQGDTCQREGYNYFSVKWCYVSVGDQYGWIQTYDGDWFNPTVE